MRQRGCGSSRPAKRRARGCEARSRSDYVHVRCRWPPIGTPGSDAPPIASKPNRLTTGGFEDLPHTVTARRKEPVSSRPRPAVSRLARGGSLDCVIAVKAPPAQVLGCGRPHPGCPGAGPHRTCVNVTNGDCWSSTSRPSRRAASTYGAIAARRPTAIASTSTAAISSGKSLYTSRNLGLRSSSSSKWTLQQSQRSPTNGCSFNGTPSGRRCKNRPGFHRATLQDERREGLDVLPALSSDGPPELASHHSRLLEVSQIETELSVPNSSKGSLGAGFASRARTLSASSTSSMTGTSRSNIA